MYKITKKNKTLLLTLLLSFGISIVSSLSYLFVYSQTAKSEVQNRLHLEAEEIVSQHITIEDGRILYNNQEDGLTIENDLLSDQLSAVVYNKQGKIIGRFGLADKNKYPEISYDLSIYKDSVKDTLLNGSYNFIGDLTWKPKNNLYAISYPIVTESGIYGSILVLAPIDSWNISLKVTLINLIAILPLSFLLSLFLSSVITKYSFSEIQSIKNRMKSITSNELDNYIDEKTFSEDEVLDLVKEYNEMLKRLKDGFDKQKQFVANASHELKTPITKVLNSLEIMKFNDNSNVKDINTSINQLLELSKTIDTLLNFAKYNEVKKLTVKDINLYNEITTVISKYSSEINNKEIKVSLKINKNLKIKTNSDYFKIIIQNIISNAIKYNKYEGEIFVVAKELKKTRLIIIKDTGIGLKTGQLKKINDRFYKADHNSKSSHGLGLAIAFEISKALNYTIEIDSEYTKWTTVTVVIPTEI